MIAEKDAVEKAVDIIKRYRTAVKDAQSFVMSNPIPRQTTGHNVDWIEEWLKNNALENLLTAKSGYSAPGRIE